MKVTIAAPTGGSTQEGVATVALRTTEGQIAVLEHHADFLAAVVPGPLRLETSGGAVRGVIGAGVLRVEGGDVFLAVDQWETGTADKTAVAARIDQLSHVLTDRNAHPAAKARARRELAFLEAWVAAR